MKPLIAKIVAEMQRINDYYQSYTIRPIKADYLDGFKLSEKIIKQQEEVPITPIMKNILKKYDPKIDRLTIHDPETNAEKFVHKYVEDKLTKRFGVRNVDYVREDIFDPQLQAVDNWRNFKDDMRHIRPKQSKDREATIARFYKGTQLSTEDIIEKLEKDIIFQKAVEVVYSELPSVKAIKDIVEVSIPFMNKHTNVSFPFWKNDRAISKTGQNYAKLTLDIAKKLSIPDVHKYNVSTLYGRNQRGKGRAIIATSRISTLVLNRLEAAEIKAYKAKSSLFIGYGDDSDLKYGLVKVAKFAQANGYSCENFDYSKFDSTVSEGFIVLLGAISILKSINQDSKEIAFHRCITNLKTLLVNGYSKQTKPSIIYGRVFSGHIDTNRGGGIINAIAATYALIKQDPQYVSNIAGQAPVRMLVMGDDNLCVTPKNFNRFQFVKDLKSLGFTVHPDKGEYGPFFLQYRLLNVKADQTILNHDLSNYKMTYPWTRVLISCLFKENTVGLGEYGWTIAIWQQLSKLVEDRQSLRDILPLLKQFDKNGLHLNTPISTIKQGISNEDKSAAGQKTFKKRNMPTALKLYDGDPSKDRFFIKKDNGDIQINDDYLSKLQSILRRAID